MLEDTKKVIAGGKNLEELTASLDDGMNETAAGMSQINAAITRIQEISVENKDSIDVLRGEISKFKVK